MTAAIDPRLAYTRVPLPDDRNAWPLWKEAARWRVTGALDPPYDDLVSPEDFAEWQARELNWPQSEFGRRILKLIEYNAPALKLLDLGIARGKLQLPEFNSPKEWESVWQDVSVLRYFPRVRSRRIEYRAWRGDFEAASQDAINQLRMGDMVCNGEGVVVDYLFGTALRGIAQSDILFLARQATPPCLLTALLAAVEQSLASPDGLAASIRVDFWKFGVENVERVVDQGDLQTVLDSVQAHFYDNEPTQCEEGLSDVEERLAWRRRCLLDILSGHARPFDKASTIALIRDQLSSAINSLEERPRLPRFSLPSCVRAMDRRIRFWRRQRREVLPFQLTPGCPLTYVGDAEETKSALASLCEGLDGSAREHAQPVTAEVLATVKRRIHSIDNPLGVAVANLTMQGAIPRSIMLYRIVCLEAVKAILAIRIYHESSQRLPTSLNELVNERIISTLPMDPYSCRPLRYCPRRAIIWSVGGDGRNCRGNAAHETNVPGHPIRWEIPVDKQSPVSTR